MVLRRHVRCIIPAKLRLNRYKNKHESTEPYEERIEKNLDDPVKMIVAGMMVDIDELLDNYRFEIKRIEIARKKRMKYLRERSLARSETYSARSSKK